jgi:quinolinate synthase
LLPDLKAGCSLADSCNPVDFAAFKAQNPGHIVISYVNCSAAIKALTDIVCTSTNAVQIVESLPENQKIIFAPDKNLGAYIKKTTGRDMLLWDGACMVHEIFSFEKIVRLLEKHPGAKLIAHPECEAHILDIAHYVGSTSGLLNFIKNDSAKEFIVATETGILHQMMKAAPEKSFIPAPPNNSCACNDCPHMKLNTLEKLYTCLKYETPEIIMEDDLIKRAEVSIKRMLEISEKYGL